MFITISAAAAAAAEATASAASAPVDKRKSSSSLSSSLWLLLLRLDLRVRLLRLLMQLMQMEMVVIVVLFLIHQALRHLTFAESLTAAVATFIVTCDEGRAGRARAGQEGQRAGAGSGAGREAREEEGGKGGGGDGGRDIYPVLFPRVKRHQFIGSNNDGVDDTDGGVSAFADDEVKPTFLSSRQNVTVNPGDRATLTCRVQHLGRKTVTWRRRGDIHPMTIGSFIFVSDTRLTVERKAEMNEWRLIIDDVKPTDEGTYQCQINTKEDQRNHYDVHLQVKTVHVRGTETVERGGSIELTCNVSGRPDPPHNIEWYKDGLMIESNSAAGVVITKKIETDQLVSVLVIRRSKMTDAGVYHCRTSYHHHHHSHHHSAAAADVSGHLYDHHRNESDDSEGSITVEILSAPMEKRAEKAKHGRGSSGVGCRSPSLALSSSVLLGLRIGWILRIR